MLVRRWTCEDVARRALCRDDGATPEWIDARRLYPREAFPSMFAYCTGALHLSEGEAYLRIAVARAARRHPVLLAMLADGRLHLSGIERLAPHLTAENRDEVLQRAPHRSKREIEQLAAELAPRPDVPAGIRRLPARTASGPRPRNEGRQLRPDGVGGETAMSPPPAKGGDGTSRAVAPGGSPLTLSARPPASLTADRRAAPEPLAPDRFKVQFTASADLCAKIERLKALLRPAMPEAGLADVIDRAVSETLERLEARRFALTRKPRKSLADTDTRPGSRHIPAAVRRAVHQRDGGRCTFTDRGGRRCPARHDSSTTTACPSATAATTRPRCCA